MPLQASRPKAIALMSGGLDSTLAARLAVDMGFEVTGLHLASPFACRADVQKSADEVGVSLIVKDKGEAYLELLQNPKFGYGKAVNPCIDCRVYMFEMAETVRKDISADIIVTGEVVGQRPMSQKRDTMKEIDKESLMSGLIFRPLSAKLFPPTVAEEKGWVRRDELLAFYGRNRTPQIQLAKKLGLTAFESPGGGCLLTDLNFAPRLRDFFAHESTAFKKARSELLRYGRHFRFSDSLKVVLGRNASECEILKQKWTDTNGILFDPVGFQGPVALALGDIKDEDFKKIGSLILRYSKCDENTRQELAYCSLIGKGSFHVSERMREQVADTLKI